ncbi:hypothetical protein [Paenibacillus sp. J2TS4]|uniref:hypothetical protein n=1 Tax=Paenibacillus sp. J2TS4 TaxID=2807194 RepID=UPI001B21A27B|nr:hypothetical protein [Paenibacillus sp. J2TS4]GIP33854.1 hypothetical protein J2TS4_30640 [Paenibacillus sp. J2TS4]
MIDRFVPEIVQALWKHEPSLHPKGTWQQELNARIASVNPEQLGSVDSAKLPYGLAVKSGLYLWNEDLYESHELSQQIDNETGSFWHGIMHRMEGDYGNAKYWFRRTGVHPVHSQIHDRVKGIFSGREGGFASSSHFSGLSALASHGEWDPYRFTDLVESTSGSNDQPVIRLMQTIQRLEIVLLLEYSYQQYCGGSLIEYSS